MIYGHKTYQNTPLKYKQKIISILPCMQKTGFLEIKMWVHLSKILNIKRQLISALF